jgi:hypothetical protein
MRVQSESKAKDIHFLIQYSFPHSIAVGPATKVFRGTSEREAAPHFDRPGARQAFVALAGEDSIVFDQHLAYVEKENVKHRRKASLALA